MSTTVLAPRQLVEQATAIAKSKQSMELLDLATILHGYLELTTLDPDNGSYRKNVEDAASSVMRATDWVVAA